MKLGVEGAKKRDRETKRGYSLTMVKMICAPDTVPFFLQCPSHHTRYSFGHCWRSKKSHGWKNDCMAETHRVTDRLTDRSSLLSVINMRDDGMGWTTEIGSHSRTGRDTSTGTYSTSVSPAHVLSCFYLYLHDKGSFVSMYRRGIVLEDLVSYAVYDRYFTRLQLSCLVLTWRQ